MEIGQRVELTRSCDAIRVPDGGVITLDEGTPVTVMQSLGDTYTVMTEIGMMARIADEDADAIGREPRQAADECDPNLPVPEQVTAQLKTCFDPEIPVNIVDLGLVYACDVTEAPEGGSNVAITMTLTAPGCGMGEVLAADVRRKVAKIRGVRHIEVNLVFDPPWDRSRMSEAAQLQLGMM